MKGLIMCAGLGSRLRPITHTLPKHLIPLANKPMLFYIIDILVDLKINEIGILVGKTRDTFEAALNEHPYKDVSFHLINQEKPLGIANGLLKAEDFISDEAFLLVLGDNYYDPSIKSSISKMIDSQYNHGVLIKAVDNPDRYGIVKLDRNSVIDVIEKPNNPPSNLALVGLYKFDKSIFTACKNIKPSYRREYELTDAMKWLINSGHKITYEKIYCNWKDLGRPDDILDINQYLLSGICSRIKGLIDTNSTLEGEVQIGENSIIKDCLIKGPVTIGNNTVIENSIIGPNTSIYHQVTISNCEIQNSIILDECTISNIEGVIVKSIFERGCIIEGGKKNREDTKKGSNKNKKQLLLGKNSRMKEI